MIRTRSHSSSNDLPPLEAYRSCKQESASGSAPDTFDPLPRAAFVQENSENWQGNACLDVSNAHGNQTQREDGNGECRTRNPPKFYFRSAPIELQQAILSKVDPAFRMPFFLTTRLSSLETPSSAHRGSTGTTAFVDDQPIDKRFPVMPQKQEPRLLPLAYARQVRRLDLKPSCKFGAFEKSCLAARRYLERLKHDRGMSNEKLSIVLTNFFNALLVVAENDGRSNAQNAVLDALSDEIGKVICDQILKHGVDARLKKSLVKCLASSCRPLQKVIWTHVQTLAPEDVRAVMLDWIREYNCIPRCTGIAFLLDCWMTFLGNAGPGSNWNQRDELMREIVKIFNEWEGLKNAAMMIAFADHIFMSPHNTGTRPFQEFVAVLHLTQLGMQDVSEHCDRDWKMLHERLTWFLSLVCKRPPKEQAFYYFVANTHTKFYPNGSMPPEFLNKIRQLGELFPLPDREKMRVLTFFLQGPYLYRNNWHDINRTKVPEKFWTLVKCSLELPERARHAFWRINENSLFSDNGKGFDRILKSIDYLIGSFAEDSTHFRSGLLVMKFRMTATLMTDPFYVNPRSCFKEFISLLTRTANYPVADRRYIIEASLQALPFLPQKKCEAMLTKIHEYIGCLPQDQRDQASSRLMELHERNRSRAAYFAATSLQALVGDTASNNQQFLEPVTPATTL